MPMSTSRLVICAFIVPLQIRTESREYGSATAANWQKGRKPCD
jgi:hypothetical protein